MQQRVRDSMPGNPHGNGVWPGEVLHGDHQLMRPDRVAAPPAGAVRLLFRATVRLTPSSPAVAFSPLCSLIVTSAIASNAAIVGVRRAPCTTGRSSKGQLQQQRVT